MAEEVKSNLEPIGEGDLGLREKFIGGGKTPETAVEETTETKVEKISAPEQTVERKEGQAEKDSTYSKILSKVTTQHPVKDEEVTADASIVSQEKDAEAKVSTLVQIAETKGIPHAVKVAQHYQDNYILDELHDRLLAENLHNALVKKGMIKEI